MKDEIQKLLDDREKQRAEELKKSNEFKNSSEIQQTEFVLALRLQNLLRL